MYLSVGVCLDEFLLTGEKQQTLRGRVSPVKMRSLLG